MKVIMLSEHAKKAIAWLFNEDASEMEAGAMRAEIIKRFGVEVDKEIQSYLCPPDDPLPACVPDYAYIQEVKQ